MRPDLPPDPAAVYRELFIEVQRRGIFPDQKTFVDCVPKLEPHTVLEHYARAKEDDEFDLGAFVREHFLVPEACSLVATEAESVEHHLAHIASSFYSSDFERAAGFSYDAAGDFTSAMYARCEGNRIEALDRVFMPDSLGYFYTALCQFIGFDRA